MKIDSRKPDLKAVKIGTVVITTKGFEFSRVENGWLDSKTKLTWFYPEPKKLNQYEAMEKYNSPSKRLPTKDEFEDAEKHGFREVLEINSSLFWSSSVYPSYSYYAYFFNGNYGDIGYVSRSYYNDAAVCVSGR